METWFIRQERRFFEDRFTYSFDGIMDLTFFETISSSNKSLVKLNYDELNQQDNDRIPSAPDRCLDLFSLNKSSFDITMSQVLTPRPRVFTSGDMNFKQNVSQQTKQQHFDNRRKPMTDKNGCFGMKPEITTPAVHSQPDAQGSEKASKLRSIEEIPSRFRHIFKFHFFNVLQSRILDEVLYTDKSVVVSAPTGSGKTVVFEIALIRLLMKTEHIYKGKIIYMAPMKALCTERFQDWQEKFPDLKCLKVTGDSEIDDVAHLKDVNLICTTPEKWDSMSRRWKDKKGFFQGIRLFLIDEIHVLNDKTRGATVEAVVSRMKTLQTAASLEDSSNAIRFIAVSATLPNYHDIAEWLSTPSKPASAYNIEEKHRPVRIERFVIGYPFKKGTSDFRFDMNLSYRLRGIIDTHCHGKPTLVFCSSRKSVIQSGEILAKSVHSLMTHDNAHVLQQAAMTVREQKVSELLNAGIGVHHAGLTKEDRQTVEKLFRNSQLPVLISTSTLAMGVNLPAHLVVIKSTHFYNMGAIEEYSDMQLLQMIGRAGRPQFDSSATAVIMTKDVHKSRYESLVKGTQLVESSLHKNLIEHLNAEIVLQTITDMALAIEWMRQTFLYVRVLKNPKYYGLPVGLSKGEVEKRLQDLCLKDLNLLTGLGLVTVEDESYAIIPQETGRLMARYCIAFETMKHFHNLGDHQESVGDMIDVISACAEFEDIQLRANEKRILNSLNRDKSKESIRFPFLGKIKNKQMKVNCLIQAQLSCLPVQDFSLSQDITKIFRVGQRVAKCLMELLYLQGGNYSLMLHAILVYKGLKTRLWFDSRLISRQLDGIGPTMSLALAKAGLNSFQMLEQAHPRDIEVIVNRHHPFGNQVKDSVSRLPRYELAVEQVNKHTPGKATLSIGIDLLNRTRMDEELTGSGHQALLVIGDEDNTIVFKWRIMDNRILNGGMWTRIIEVKRAMAGPKLSISLLSLDWVGLDIQTEYEPVYSPGWQNTLNQGPASKLKDSMDRAKQKKNFTNTPNVSKVAFKRPQTSKGQSGSNKQAKIEPENVSEKADILSTILRDMEKTFPSTQSRITLNKFAYEKPESLSHRKGGPDLNSSIQQMEPDNETKALSSSFSHGSVTNRLHGNECNDGIDDDIQQGNGWNLDTAKSNPNVGQSYFSAGYTNELSSTLNQSSHTNQTKQRLAKYNSVSGQNRNDHGKPISSVKYSGTQFDLSKKEVAGFISNSNPISSLYSRAPQQLLLSHKVNTISHVMTSPSSIPSNHNSVPEDSQLSTNTSLDHGLTQNVACLLPTFHRKSYAMGSDVDDFMRQQGYSDADNLNHLTDEEKNICVEEILPGTSHSDEELYHFAEEHELNYSLPIEDCPNTNKYFDQETATSNLCDIVEIDSTSSSSPLPSPHHTELVKPLQQSHGINDIMYCNVDDACDEISWSPLSSQLSQQIPLHGALGKIMTKEDRFDRDTSSVKQVKKSDEQAKATVASPHQYGLVQAWPRTSKTQEIARSTMECLCEKRSYKETATSSGQMLPKKNGTPRPSQHTSMFIPQHQSPASESYVPGKLFDGIFDFSL